jgi:small-conductance mechanosensitive channel
MQELINMVTEYLQGEQALSIFRAILILVAGLILARVISSLLVRVTRGALDRHRLLLLRRGTFYAIAALFITAALIELGFDLGILLGTAGIVTVALAFASQTSMSNFISGLFLIAEGPFQIGDLIRLGTTTGEVMEIDLLSVKLRQFDNTFVRLPNELLIKSEVKTLTKYPIRRVDLALGVAYKENIGRVREILNKVAEANPLCLEEPAPLFVFSGFGESAINIQFSVWAASENFLEVKNSIQQQIKEAFDEADIVIPFPQRTLHSGRLAEPFPLQPGSQETPSDRQK